MTNLTDEGLKKLASDVITGNSGYMALVALDEHEKIKSVASALQQVRDAAKKEERELTCKLIMGLPLKRKHPLDYSSDYTREELCTAIRQMDGGN